MDIFPVTWSAGDTGPGGTCRVTSFGKNRDGESVCLHVRFTPYFFVEMPAQWTVARSKLFIAECGAKFDVNTARCQIVERASIWGFRNGATGLFAQLAFDSMEAAKLARWRLNKEHRIYEAGVDPVMRLFHLRGLGPCAWMKVSKYESPKELVADTDHEIECLFTAVGPSDVTSRPPLVFASWDIECYSSTGKFPMADNPNDKLIQIAVAFQRYGEPEPYHRAVVCLDSTDDVDGVEIIWTPHENQVIEKWGQLMRDHKADTLVGYNTHQFDWRYISGRIGVLVDDDTGQPLVNLDSLGRMVEGGGDVREYEMNSGAYGQNKFFVLQTPGNQQIDLLQYMRREFKLDSYSLDNVSKHFLQSQKLDLPASQIFAKFTGTSADRADIARYAVRDTELPLRLMTKLSVWENLSEMANAVKVPMDYLLNRGQQVCVPFTKPRIRGRILRRTLHIFAYLQIKVYSVILGKARQMGYVIPDNEGIGVPEGVKYEGATVLEATRGAYFEVVSGLDFASL